jgi:hypothetical protein
MKQLTKEQQEQAVELIERSIRENQGNYIQSAKTFLQSLKPKIYIGCLEDDGIIIFLQHENENYWVDDIEQAKSFNEYDEAKISLDNIKKYKGNRYFILTE